MSNVALDDTYENIVNIPQRTVNIPGLERAGELFKYEAYMPDTSHYWRIDEEVFRKHKISRKNIPFWVDNG